MASHTHTPQPSTLNPQPSALNPKPSTLNPQPSARNPTPEGYQLISSFGSHLQGYLAHNKLRPPPGSPQGTRHSPSVGS